MNLVETATLPGNNTTEWGGGTLCAHLFRDWGPVNEGNKKPMVLYQLGKRMVAVAVAAAGRQLARDD